MNNFHELFFSSPRRFQTNSTLKPTIISELFGDCDFSSSYINKDSNYKLYEEDNKIVYKCVAPLYEEKDLDIKIDNKSLNVKSNLKNKEELEFHCFSDRSFKFKKDIDPISSFATLDKGVLTVTMPIKSSSKMTDVKFI